MLLCLLRKYVCFIVIANSLALGPVHAEVSQASLCRVQKSGQLVNSKQDGETKGDQDDETKETDTRLALSNKIRDEYWEKVDKKGLKRKAEPRLFPAHEKMTAEWVEKLDSKDFQVLSGKESETQSEDDAKRLIELERAYSKKSLEVATHIGLARKLVKKISKAHWEGMEKTGIKRENCPEFAQEFEISIESWFFDRTIEDLKIFEKGKPNESERERGSKITSELVKKIEDIKKKYEGNPR